MRQAKPADKARDVPPTLVAEDAKIARVPAPRELPGAQTSVPQEVPPKVEGESVYCVSYCVFRYT